MRIVWPFSPQTALLPARAAQSLVLAVSISDRAGALWQMDLFVHGLLVFDLTGTPGDFGEIYLAQGAGHKQYRLFPCQFSHAAGPSGQSAAEDCDDLAGYSAGGDHHDL